MNIEAEIGEVQALLDILTEKRRAERKHPNWPVDQIHAAGIVGEEFGELLRDAVQYEREHGGGQSLENMEKEAIQTAATCVRLIEFIRENKGRLLARHLDAPIFSDSKPTIFPPEKPSHIQ